MDTSLIFAHSHKPEFSKKPCILAIEDDEDNLLILDYLVNKLNYLFIPAGDSLTALSLLDSYSPDLILLDIKLPQFDGFYFMSQLKKYPSMANIPVIAVTGLVSLADQQKIKEAGCIDYLSKPYLLEELESLIIDHLNNSILSSSLISMDQLNP